MILPLNSILCASCASLSSIASEMVFSSIIHYNEGTLVIDFYDAVKKNLIFQGTLTTVVKDKPQKREKSIPENVAKLMKKYSIKPIE